ncbi:putative undecaprenyl-phosphate glycosyl-1-phosphate transferase [Carnobacterium sp. AT7]|uniref:sugar transferase n=1 Tax=Carnobacterium TaxID=2747 RepID=UPI00015F2BE3|nr:MULTISPECIES: sugar transferase [Carnobacterium]EDP67475.1 putative undecaprenyl-phosphate glycosyl-1-phosphate transferase [Carnobacterium sp. AT7]
MKNYYPVKSIIEWIFAGMLFLLVLPILFILGILIKLEDPTGPIFFIQERVGKDNEIFNMYKLRSMKNPTAIGNKELSYDERMLKIGQFIRKLSLDELPQLINILKGDMSFIGPRPLLVYYLPCYNETELHRHDVKPGISGWAQVNGRNNLSWEERFALDVEYVEKCSFLFDVKIVLITIKKVLMKADIVEKEVDYIIAFDEYRKMQWKQEEVLDNVTPLFPDAIPLEVSSIVENREFKV